MLGRAFLLLLTVLLSTGGAAAELQTGLTSLFPKPVRLVPQVEFWKMVYSQFSTRQALVHDDRDLTVIYEVVPLPSPNWKVSKGAAQAVADRYRGILRQLGAGPIDTLRLSAEARQVWGVWGKSLDPGVYRKASDAVRVQRCLSDEFRTGLDRASRYRERMRRLLRKGGIPEVVWALALVESPFEIKARSRAGAVGVWQITDWEKKRYMPRIRGGDPRHDPLMSTEAVAKILRHNFDLLGNWPLAITAYNHGLPGMLRARSETGSEDVAHIISEYKGPLFKFASRNYYTEFLAALELVEAPEPRFASVSRPAAQDTNSRMFLGSLTSHRFHRPSCRWVRDIKQSKRVWFTSGEEAAHRGYIACNLCKPGKERGGGRPLSVAKE